MKSLKWKLEQIRWKNENVFERVEKLRIEVKKCQNDVDRFPHDESIKDRSCSVLKDYHEAIQDGYSLLCQKAKVEWLKEGDRNTAYFHKTIKERVHRGKSRQVQKMDGRQDIFTNRIKPEEALRMVRPISDSEIKNEMFEIEDSKAPVFCHGDSYSLKVIKKSLDEFNGYTGLLPNMQKSTIFFGGLSSAEKQNILNIIPFTEGKFLVRYLGVPLITKQLSISDCKPLVNKVQIKISDWKNKSLSYAGRVIYEINKLLKGFLWCKGEQTKGKAKVSWDAVCKPKDQGGLGLKNLGVWNEIQVPILRDDIKDIAV
ncbi:hypothetical protein Tco_0709606 [Tanacetum coccineum]